MARVQNDSLSAELASLRIDRADRNGVSRPTSSPSPPAGRARRGLSKRWIALLAMVGVGAVSAVSARPLLARVQRPVVRATEIAQVAPSQASVELTATGYVVAQRTAKVGAKVQGRITKTNAREGDRVRQGDVLFELDPTDQRRELAAARARVDVARAKVQVARATLAETERSLAREKKLAASGAVAAATAEDMETRSTSLSAAVSAAEAEIRAASADAARIEAALHDMRVLAPIDGVLTTKPLEVGEVVTNETPLVEILDPASLLVEVDVPEGRAGAVATDAPCEVVLDAFPNDRHRGQVVMVGPRLNRAKATAMVKVKFLDTVPQLRAEMAARVGFLREALDPEKLHAAPKSVVPKSAVVERGGQKVVFALRGDAVHLERVTLGEAFGAGFVLAEGPSPGTRVAENPGPDLVDGQMVKESEAK
ncbi:efflux RND transporter periplasmic adaptor subunit [Pendulispora rubella]|uniref:Efflux RND transporter periplasmic adaptor subunit n=1 Tax=Pendulispora rubella TaxID=2741070 RepID=A0ABZ2LFZ7_9BACT